MNLTLHLAPEQPLLLPLVSEEPSPSDAHRVDQHPMCEAHLCHVLIERAAQTHPIVIAEPAVLDDWGCSLQQALQEGVRRILVLPWNLHAATALLVRQAMHTLHQAGAETVSASSLLLTHPVTVPGVSPVGPLGGLLPPQERLDRLVEQWPGWRHAYTLVRSEQAAILILHTGTAHPAPQSDQSLSGNHQRLKQALHTTLCQAHGPQEKSDSDSVLQRDSTIYAHYLSGMIVAALDVLASLPRVPQD